MARIGRLIGIAAVSLTLTGCVTQEKYNALKLDRDALQEQLARAQSDSSSARAEASSFRSQLDGLMANGNNQTALTSNLQQQLASLQSQYDELNRRYVESMSRPMGGPLPQELSNTLTTFAQQNPDLVEFDAARGMVKFKSDVTFASGDATVTAKAQEVLAKFATILNSPAASKYELLIAGHTDNMRVSNPTTIAKGHKDNWFLSAHRAISVANELMGKNVASNRVGVLGYGEQRPVASNGSEAGRASNRRVEVLILPNTIRGSSVATQSPAAPAKPNLNKDGAQAITPGDSAFNK